MYPGVGSSNSSLSPHLMRGIGSFKFQENNIWTSQFGIQSNLGHSKSLFHTCAHFGWSCQCFIGSFLEIFEDFICTFGNQLSGCTLISSPLLREEKGLPQNEL